MAFFEFEEEEEDKPSISLKIKLGGWPSTAILDEKRRKKNVNI